MAVSSRPNSGGYLERPRPSGLADVIDIILDKGLVIDIYVRVALVGIEILTIDARIVVASVDTYLRFAEAVGRLDLERDRSRGLPPAVGPTIGGATPSAAGAVGGATGTSAPSGATSSATGTTGAPPGGGAQPQRGTNG